MGNRTFLYTADRLPDPAADVSPQICQAVAEANNWLPPLFRLLLSATHAGPAQDAQQVFLPSLLDGVYAERAEAERRMFGLLGFLAAHPLLDDPDAFQAGIDGLRAALAGVTGDAYCADLNEWYALDDDGLEPDAWLDQFARDCADEWGEAERAIGAGEHAAIDQLYEFDPQAPAASLGFDCWLIGPAWGDRCGEDRADSDALDEEHGGYLGEFAQLFRANGKYGVRHPDSGAVLQPPLLDEVFDAAEGAAVACVDGRYGYLDADGSWLVAPRYDSAFGFSQGMALVIQGGLAGYIDRTGHEAIAPRFLPESGSFEAPGLAAVQTLGGFGLIDRSGALVLPATCAAIERIEGVAAWMAVGADAVAQVLHANGSPWFAGRIESIWPIGQDDVVVEQDGKLGTWRHDGRPGLPLGYDEIELLAPALDGADALFVIGLDTRGKRLRGLARAGGEVLIAPEFSAIDAVVLVEQPDGRVHMPPPAWMRIRRGRDGHGLWSLAARAFILPFEYRDFWLTSTVHGVMIVAHRRDGAWSIHRIDGAPVNPTPFDWLGSPDNRGDAWTMPLFLDDLARAWNEDGAILAGRGEQAVYLLRDGAELSELDYLLHRTRAAAPILAPRGLLRKALGRRSHALEGVGDAEACARLGDMYAFGEGVLEDCATALRWYATAAHADHQEARYQYACWLADGIGCAPDPQAAREQLELLGPHHARACNLLGTLYESALGDPVRARQLYEQAAGSDQHGLAIAQFNAGDCWRHGIGGPVDMQQALKYFELAAARSSDRKEPCPEGLRGAAQLYGQLARAAFDTGQSKEHSRALKRALRYYQDLLACGEHDALIGLARCHLGEYGGAANHGEARRWIEQALRVPEVADMAAGLRDQYRLA